LPLERESKLCIKKGRLLKLCIVVANDGAESLPEIVSLLGTEFSIVATATDGKQALESIHRYRPDVVVLQLEMPPFDDMDVLRELRKDPSSPAVVICSEETDPSAVAASLKAGARAYVFKARIHRDLLDAVRAVARGKHFVSRR
jgi:DNA-binding NarL/FixJ family response regulator